MGTKGDEMTHDSEQTAKDLLEKLAPLEGITSKKMFGGHGIFHDDVMFGLVDSQGEAFLKVDDTNRGDYEAVGAHVHGKMPYFSIPKSVMEDQSELLVWAKKSIKLSK